MVSIIIPAYNCEDYIENAIQSALEQDCNKEVIVVEDHSNDNTWELLQEKFGEHPFVNIYKNDKKGGNFARNFGANKSRGDYLQFLDADDILGKDKIKTQLECFEKHGDNIITSSSWIHFENASELVPTDFAEAVWKDYNNPIQWLIDSWSGGGMMQTGCWLIPRKIFIKSGGYDETIVKNQDGELICRILLHCDNIIFSEDAWVYYRMPTKNSTSRQTSYEACDSLLRSYISYESNLLPKYASDEMNKALANNYFRFIYEVSPKFPDLLLKARQNIKKLKVRKPVSIGGNNFRKMSGVLGFDRAVGLRDFINQRK